MYIYMRGCMCVYTVPSLTHHLVCVSGVRGCMCVYTVPSLAPVIIHVSEMSTAIHIKWSRPASVNAPLISYRLSLTGPNGSRVRVVAANDASVTSAAKLTMLQPGTTYTVTVAAVNVNGAGPSQQVTVKTLPASQSK